MRTFALASLAIFLAIPSARADEPKAPSLTPDPTIAERYKKIRAEYDVAIQALRKANREEGSRDKSRASAKQPIDLAAEYARRVVDLAETKPDDLASRDALVWAVDVGPRDIGSYGDQVARAGALLVRHYGDDPEAVRIGLNLENVASPWSEALLLGFYASARGREAKGLARLALAQYLIRKAMLVTYARKTEGRPKRRMFNMARNSVREFDLTDEEFAIHLGRRLCDPEAIQAEGLCLFKEVISDYADIPYITRRHRELEALLKEPDAQRNGQPLTADDRAAIEKRLARRSTLGEVAEARLDAMFNLVAGKPAPEIEGLDMNGKPMKLSDYRGKVVMLVFWGTWCGPCMAMVPHERELVERFQGRPFAMLGVDCLDSKEKARAVMARERMTWPSWYDGNNDLGPIAKRYHIRGFPSIFVVDAKGIIQGRTPLVDKLIEKLLAEMESKAPGQRHDRPRTEAGN